VLPTGLGVGERGFLRPVALDVLCLGTQ
jgi:hypothetical protein